MLIRLGRVSLVGSLVTSLLMVVIACSVLPGEDRISKPTLDEHLIGSWWFKNSVVNCCPEDKLDPDYLVFGVGFCTFKKDGTFFLCGHYAAKRVEKELIWSSYPEEKPARLELRDKEKVYLKAIYKFVEDKLVIAFYPQGKLAVRETPKNFTFNWDKGSPPVCYVIATRIPK